MKQQEEMNILIPQKLKEIEAEYNITILLAVESGSRAWGFASTDSDFDVRFIYKRKASDYLRLEPQRDVIEIPIDDVWDVSGWDLDKTLRLLQKSNPTLFEWINSPIVYLSTEFSSRLKPVMDKCFSNTRMLYHYLSMAKHNIKAYLMEETVIPKKYFYALRPILACMWVMKHHTAPPVLFSQLCDTVLPSELKDSIDYLLDLKVNGPEKMRIPRLSKIDKFLADKVAEIDLYLINYQESIKDTSDKWDILNKFFYEEISL